MGSGAAGSMAAGRGVTQITKMGHLVAGKKPAEKCERKCLGTTIVK